MADSLSKFIAIVIAAFLLFIFPVKNEFERQDETSRMFVLTETTKFVDSARNIGYITPLMYLQFSKGLSATGNVYEIELEHYHKKYDPIYDDPSVAASFKEDFSVNYSGTFTDEILKKLFPGDSAVTDRTYKMSKGDYFAVRIYNKNKTIATRMQEMVYNTKLPAEKIMVEYGGMVKDEDY